VGVFEDIDMFVAVGRFGPYIRHDGAFYSLPKGMDPFDVEEEIAIEIIKTKRQKDIDKIIRTFDENPDVRIEEGRWGPFIRFGKQNVKIPKGTKHEDLTYEDIVKLAEEDPKFKKGTKVAPKAKAAKAKAAPKTKTTAKKTTKKAAVKADK
jgi:DNA topoisomerase-1